MHLPAALHPDPSIAARLLPSPDMTESGGELPERNSADGNVEEASREAWGDDNSVPDEDYDNPGHSEGKISCALT